MNRNTASRFYLALRAVIAGEMEKAAPLHGEVEVDESYFGGRRKGKRSRGAAGKASVFSLLKHGGRVYTLPIHNARIKKLIPISESRVSPDSTVYTGSFASYDVIDVATFRHQRIDQGKVSVGATDRKRHTGGIENFWDQTKRHLRRQAKSPESTSNF